MLILSKYLLIFFIFLLSFSAFSQTKEALKKQKIAIEKEIDYTQELLKNTKKNKDQSLSYLKVLDKQIKNQEYFLQTLNIEISLLNKQFQKTEKNIVETEYSIKQEKESLGILKSEYAKMIYACFKKKGDRNNLIFIISANDLDDAAKKVVAAVKEAA